MKPEECNPDGLKLRVKRYDELTKKGEMSPQRQRGFN